MVRALSVTVMAVATASVLTPRLVEAETRVVSNDTTGRGAAKKAANFREVQQNHERVLAAKVEKRFELKKLFRERGLEFPAAETFMRIFKRERVLEVWVRPNAQSEFALLKAYPICALAGEAGPKRSRGDGQTPEGFYHIDSFNPVSAFHLALHIDYPNRSDQLLSPGKDLGGDIMIHGGCKTEGCLAVTDDAIKELYWLAVEARNSGQSRIPVHIFPAKLSDDALYKLVTTFDENPDLKRFWANLKPGFDYFETNKKLPLITIDARGRYRIKPLEAPPVVAAADTAKN
jgi:murein L,D-transpeptidase YafK